MYKFIAHRGNDDNLLENSMKAILNSLSKTYIDGVEFDIRITKDNHFIIHHNATINTNNKNLGLIKNMTLKEIKKIKIKYHNQIYRIATLKEVLKKITGSKIILIEIKEEQNYSELQKKKLINILNKFPNLNIYLMSFNYLLIKSIKKKYPHSGLLIGKILNRSKDFSTFPFLAVPLDFYKKYEGIQEIFIWTINKEKELKEIKNNSYIITDKAYNLFKNSSNRHELF